ncbi:MAG: 2-succinyl-5-enolpyruvyl-6-hydroxy-3-cyclohexene-1-carboxylic-acid synthase [Deltaproteobacteria bacterium]|nr:2-succinyl-5-enolpyruvyl-6-hydroxy-3-cyclohexene-1-carboxylic-acid synthase [Deltaproteobacteria bacterium]
MMTGATQTLWAELIASTLADAGVRVCVVSPGSRSTPLVAALATDGRLALPTIIDERAAAFYALGAARATGEPVALVCTSGTAAAHYLPALVEASHANVPLVAITADRPPELQHCGASQTIDQVGMYGAFVRGAVDLGAPEGSPLALRAVRRKMIQAIALAKGPLAGPVHINVPLRKPLEPSAPTTDADRALAKLVAELRKEPVVARAPHLAADDASLRDLAAAIAAEPRGIVVAGALPATFAARDRVLALCRRAGYPLVAEAGSQLRFGARAGVTCVDHADVLLGSPLVPMPKLIIQLGAEPVAASWPSLAGVPRWVLAESWQDPESQARVVLGDVADSLARVTVDERANADWLAGWASAEQRARGAIDRALASHPRSEGAVVRAVVQAAGAASLQLGNSLPIRVVDLVAASAEARPVLTQRGAAGIDGLIASAAGATRAGKPVVLVLGDVSFAHDLGGLLAAREATAPLAIVVVDNGGGRIFAGLPVSRALATPTYDRHWTTAPGVDPAAVAASLGARAVTAASPAAVAAALTDALATKGTTVIHAPVTPSGAQDVRRTALELLR